eukprot:CAMPEP_0176094536 /NCGR_PEP_ID=MMETSP0120_2-20121206/47372_1 /TAXON_ID=160619 /ORGANISM="Kryptoperidinium foliaceum, Strain CCMP 1326" /LENGTH=187 /DNA_ID=CAMNT_0017428477 /DNA_START=13 /DNA_END=576 /DNA_ORIENTATION=-
MTASGSEPLPARRTEDPAIPRRAPARSPAAPIPLPGEPISEAASSSPPGPPCCQTPCSNKAEIGRAPSSEDDSSSTRRAFSPPLAAAVMSPGPVAFRCRVAGSRARGITSRRRDGRTLLATLAEGDGEEEEDEHAGQRYETGSMLQHLPQLYSEIQRGPGPLLSMRDAEMVLIDRILRGSEQSMVTF